jgi:hypothetical protein
MMRRLRRGRGLQAKREQNGNGGRKNQGTHEPSPLKGRLFTAAAQNRKDSTTVQIRLACFMSDITGHSEPAPGLRFAQSRLQELD